VTFIGYWPHSGRRLYDNNTKYIEPRPFADPVAARKLVELANAFEPVQRIYIMALSDRL
jgi:hypothetical protein